MPILVNYPPAPEEAILGAVFETLADDPVILTLDPLLNLWLLDGDPEHDDPPPESMLPCVRAILGPYPSGQWTENSHKGVLTVFLDAYVPGRSYQDQMRVAQRIAEALFPPDPARAAVVHDRYEKPGWVFSSIRRMGEVPVELPEGRWATLIRMQLDVTIIKATM